MREIDNTTTEVILGGVFAERYGREHHLVVQTPIEAIRLLMMNFPELRQDIIDGIEEGVEYHLSSGEYDIVEAQLNFPIPATRKIIFTPVPAGAKSGGLFGALETIVGVALIAVATYFSAGTLTAPVVAGLYATGASLVLGGITSLLTTVPKVNGNGSTTLQSYYFNGTNTGVVQGAPVPVCYGRSLIPAIPVSASMDAIDLSQAPAETDNKGDL